MAQSNHFSAGRGWTPAMRSGREILGIGLGLAVVLGLLAGALHGVEFPGSPSPRVAAPAPGGIATTAGPTWLPPWLQALFLFALAGAAVGLVTREGRREVFLRVAAGLGLVAIVLAVLSWLTFPGNAVALPGDPTAESPSLSAAPREAAPVGLLQPPAWATSLAALSLAAVLAWWAWRLSGRRRGAASAQEGAGPPPAADDAPTVPCRESAVPGTVALCWTRMARMLSARSRVAIARSLTPREFCEALAGMGFRHAAIRRLTGLFEEVRYGARADEPRRAEALAALAALEETYGEP